MEEIFSGEWVFNYKKGNPQLNHPQLYLKFNSNQFNLLLVALQKTKL